MKILVLSDSHGRKEPMVRCVEQVQPRHILFLGDGIRDAWALQQQFPEIPLTAVAGNCDLLCSEPGERLMELAGRRILMMHGHTRQVKFSTMAARYAAREAGAEILLFGHTHCPMVDYDGSLYTMNPGSIGYSGSYGVVTIEPDKVDCSVYRL